MSTINFLSSRCIGPIVRLTNFSQAEKYLKNSDFFLAQTHLGLTTKLRALLLKNPRMYLQNTLQPLHLLKCWPIDLHLSQLLPLLLKRQLAGPPQLLRFLSKHHQFYFRRVLKIQCRQCQADGENGMHTWYIQARRPMSIETGKLFD